MVKQDLFTPKDRLSNRYFHKRAHYLAVIASSLLERVKNAKNKEGDVWSGVEVEWELMGGDSRRPVVVVTLPKGVWLTAVNRCSLLVLRIPGSQIKLVASSIVTRSDCYRQFDRDCSR
jgi:U3 small nucleolar RNA-associated protein 22